MLYLYLLLSIYFSFLIILGHLDTRGLFVLLIKGQLPFKKKKISASDPFQKFGLHLFLISKNKQQQNNSQVPLSTSISTKVHLQLPYCSKGA